MWWGVVGDISGKTHKSLHSKLEHLIMSYSNSIISILCFFVVFLHFNKAILKWCEFERKVFHYLASEYLASEVEIVRIFKEIYQEL